MHKVSFQSAADAAVLEGYQTVVFLSDDSALLNQVRIYVDFAYIIDNHGETNTFLVFKNTVYQCGLAASQISCQKQDWHLFVAHIIVVLSFNV